MRIKNTLLSVEVLGGVRGRKQNVRRPLVRQYALLENDGKLNWYRRRKKGVGLAIDPDDSACLFGAVRLAIDFYNGLLKGRPLLFPHPGTKRTVEVVVLELGKPAEELLGLLRGQTRSKGVAL